MLPDKTASLVLELNRQLLECANQGAWARVRLLEKKRRNLLQRWLKSKGRATDQRLLACVQSVVEVDREVIRLHCVHRESQRREQRASHGCSDGIKRFSH